MNRIFRSLASVVAFGLFATLTAVPAFANSTLTYTSFHFTDIFGGTNIPGDYSTAMFVFGTVELLNPLGPNFNGSIHPVHYSFFDGRVTFTDQTPVGEQLLRAEFTTDGAGNIIHWVFFIRGDEDLPLFHRELNFSDRLLSDPDLFDNPRVPYYDYVFLQLNDPFGEDSAGTRNGPGVWSTPEPSSISLLAVGLAGLGFRLKKRKP